MGEWVPVADSVYQRRYQPEDVSVVAIVGPHGTVVVDTRNNSAEGREVVRDCAVLGQQVVAVINTHAHYDHTFGNLAFAGLPIYGHANIPRHFAAFEAPRLARVQRDPTVEPDKDWSDVELVPPSILVDEPTEIAPGGRVITLLPVPPAHTDTDLVVHVPDAGVWLLGDLTEESGRPMFGSGSFPLAWGDVLTEIAAGIAPSDVVVPGHGAVVARDFVASQAQELQRVADAIRSTHGSGVSVADVLAEHRLPWPSRALASAFERGYEQLGPGQPRDPS